MISSSPVSSTVFPKWSVTGCDSSLGGGWMIFHFRLFNFFFVNSISLCVFSICYIVLTCYVYYYCIWLSFNTLFSCFLALFLLFSPKGSVTGRYSMLGSFCYSPVYFVSLMHLHSGYYYYDYVVIVCKFYVKMKFSIESHLLRLMRLNHRVDSVIESSLGS